MFKVFINTIEAKVIIRNLFNKLEGEDVILPTRIDFDDHIVRLCYLDLIFIDINTRYKKSYLEFDFASLENDEYSKKEANFIFKVITFYNKYENEIIKIVSEKI